MLTSWPLRACFRPMGLFFQITSNSRAVMDAATATFGGYGRCEPVDSPDIQCRLMSVRGSRDGPGPPKLQLVASGKVERSLPIKLILQSVKHRRQIRVVPSHPSFLKNHPCQAYSASE